MIDYHIHTHHSIDAQGSIKDYAEEALKLGLKEICITNHCELDPQRDDNLIRFDKEIIPITRENLLKLQKEVFEIAEYYKERGLVIRFGLEVGYFDGIEIRLKEVLNGLSLDYLLAGIHCLDHICIDSSKECEKYFIQKTPVELLDNYYNTLENLIKTKIFDSIAHLDVYKKYGIEFYGEKIKNYSREMVGELFKLMKEYNIALEVNTAGLRRHKEFYPSSDFMKLARAMKIEVITIGSDCHRLEDLGRGIREGLEYARANGFTKIFGFERRSPFPIPIE